MAKLNALFFTATSPAPFKTELHSGQRKTTESISKISVIIVGFTIICIIGAWILGIPVLQILTGSELIQYRMVLILLMFAGGINALSYFGYYVLTVMRKSGMIIIGYIVSAIVAKLANEYLVARYLSLIHI